MNKREVIAKELNRVVTQKKFKDENIDEYLYASLSQPPIKIIDKCGSDDELDYIVECPNCKSYVNYGENTYMLSGHIYCDTKGCRESLINNNEYLKNKYNF